MCGIGGLWSRRVGREPAELGLQVDAMLVAMAHRGPDQTGRWSNDSEQSSMVMGACRLAIQDLTTAGSQPMIDPVTGNVIVFNGEVYNFRDLQRRLVADGHVLTSGCDTEVVIRSYGVWGPDFVSQLRGMFAFAIWDKGRGALFLARDRLGVKPLYYYQAPELFAFSSEVRALLRSAVVPATLSSTAIRSYLAFGAVSEPATIVRNVRAFPPGHCAYVLPGGLQLTRYWSLGEAFQAHRSPEPPIDREERIQRLLSESVKLRLISDAPMGIFLSGGIDSTVVAALAAENSPGRIHTVSVVFQEQQFSEKAWIDRTVSHIGSDHHEVQLTESELLRLIPTALQSYDQPTVDAINTYIVSMHARQAGLTVALSGIGGDELFGGYPAFQDVPTLRSIRRTVPAPMLRAGIALLSRLPGRRDRVNKLSQYFLNNGGNAIDAELVHRELFVAHDRHSLTSECPTSPVSDMGKGHWIPPELDDFNAISYSEMTGYLLNTLLRDTDFASMANSLEVREPYLDHELVGAVAALPGSAKRGRDSKWLLRRIARRIVPHALIQPGKRGFAFPMDRWMRGALRGEVDEVLRDRAASYQLSEIISQKAVERVWSDFADRKTSWTRPWALYVLKSWARSWAD
jgi:asparagine synthase (glutamine-hydrolysing)